jgi:GT2 family glycosyltransferase
MTPNMKLLVVILNYKTAKMTLEATEAALEALACIHENWELIIVDNDSQDGSFKKIIKYVQEKQLPVTRNSWDNVKVVESGHNGGFGAGNNFAIRPALTSNNPPEYIYLLNSDAFPSKPAIKLLADYLNQHPDTGIVGSYIHGTDGTPHTTAFRFPTIFSEFEGSIKLGIITKLLNKYVVPMGIPATNCEVDWLAGASMMIRRQVLLDIGLFDEKFFLYFEETDLCKRASNKHWKTVYVKESKVAHIGSVSTGMKQWQRIPQYWLDSRSHYFQKNHSRLYCIVATLIRLIGGALWQIRRRIQNKQDSEPQFFLRDLAEHLLKY